MTEATTGERVIRNHRVGLPARQAAVALLEAVLARGKALDAAIADQSRKGLLSNLAQRDRALARAIAGTALRRKGQLEAIRDQFLERPLPKATGPLPQILLAGLAQILFMETPQHAVVDLAVHQAQAHPRSKRFAGLVNALLRRAVREGSSLIEAQDAGALNTPDWLLTRWRQRYGDQAERVAQAHLNEAALDLSVKADAENWARRLGGVALATGSVRLKHRGRIEALEGFDEGAWWVQDAAAALPVRLLGDVAGKRVADLCAAPGGKTAQLAAAGAEVVAVDNAASRLKWLEANLARLGLDAEIVVADATQWDPGARFDAVLLDAPCLATGTIRRHPDIPVLKRRSDIEKLTRQQRRLLSNARNLTAPGGTLIYCTCSLEPEECEAQVAWALENFDDLRARAIEPAEISGETDWLWQGFLRTLPHHLGGLGDGLNGIDGFFAARLGRAA